ncbi:MAG: biopolymer transporter ExbD [Pirellulales bacterium]
MAIQLKRGNALAALNLTPLIDVLFLLLIFYLAAAKLSQEDRELDVPLPSAANAQPMTAEVSELVVNIDKTGRFVIEGRDASDRDLEDAIKRAAADNPTGSRVMIRADKHVELQRAVDVMDICLKHRVEYSLTIAEEAS